MNLLVQPSRKRAVASLQSDGDVIWASPSFGESIPISATLVDGPQGRLAPLSWSGWTSVKAALGNGYIPPVGGTFYLLSGSDQTGGFLAAGKRYKILSFVSPDDFSNIAGENVTGDIFLASGTTPTTWSHGSVLQEITSNLAYNATPAQVEAALNAMQFSAGGGSVSVSSVATGYYLVTWTQNGARTQLVGFSEYLTPISIVQTGTLTGGTVDSPEVQQVRVFQNCATQVSLSTASGGTAGVTVAPVITGGSGSNAVYSVTLDPAPYAGTFSVSVAGLFCAQVPHNDDGSTLQSALENIQMLSGTPVSGRKYVIVSFATGDTFTASGAGSNATGVVFTANGTAPGTWTHGSILSPVGTGNVSVTVTGQNVFLLNFQGAMSNFDMGTIGNDATALLVPEFLSGDLDLDVSGVELLLGNSDSVQAIFDITGIPPGKSIPQELCRIPLTINSGVIDSSSTQPPATSIRRLITLAANSTTARVQVTSGVTVLLLGPGNNVFTVTTAFSIAQGGRLDIGNNHLVLQAATGVTEADLQAMVNDGRLVCQTSRTHTIAIGDNADLGYTDSGGGNVWPLPTVAPAINSDDMLVAFTLWGDCTMDGLVNADDYAQVLAGLSGTTPTKWAWGNFRYLPAGVELFDFETFNRALASSPDPANHDLWATTAAATVTWGSISAGASNAQTLSSAAAKVGDVVALGLPASLPAGIIYTAHVSSDGSISIVATNITLLPVTPGGLSISAKTSAP